MSVIQGKIYTAIFVDLTFPKASLNLLPLLLKKILKMLGTRRKKNVLAGSFTVSLKEKGGGSIIILGRHRITVKYCILETMWNVKKFY